MVAVTNAENGDDYAGQDPINGYDLNGTYHGDKGEATWNWMRICENAMGAVYTQHGGPYCTKGAGFGLARAARRLVHAARTGTFTWTNCLALCVGVAESQGHLYLVLGAGVKGGSGTFSPGRPEKKYPHSVGACYVGCAGLARGESGRLSWSVGGGSAGVTGGPIYYFRVP